MAETIETGARRAARRVLIGAACAIGVSAGASAEPSIVEVQSRSFESAPQERGGAFEQERRFDREFESESRGGGDGDSRGELLGSETLDQIGDWTISLVRHENDVMCAMGARVGSDGEFWVKRARSTDYYFMQIFDRGWRGIRQGEAVGLVFAYRTPDSTRSADAVGVVTAETFGLDIALGDSDLSNLRRAREMEVATDNGRFLGAYDLTGSARALDALDACVRANVTPGAFGRDEERFEDFGGEQERRDEEFGGGKSSAEAGSGGGFSEDELGQTEPFGEEERSEPLAKSEPEERTGPRTDEGAPRRDDRAPPTDRDPGLDAIINRGGRAQEI